MVSARETLKADADAFAVNVLPLITNIGQRGASTLRAIAAKLNACKAETAGGPEHEGTL